MSEILLEQGLEETQEIALEQRLKEAAKTGIKLHQIHIIDGMSDEDWELRKACVELEYMQKELRNYGKPQKNQYK